VPANAWDGGERRWDAYFAVVLLGTLALILLETGTSLSGRLVAAAVVLAMVPWYLLLGRPATYSASAGKRLAALKVAYIAGLIVLLAGATYASSTASFLLLALCPQCFMALTRQWDILGALVVLNGIDVAMAALHGDSAAELATLGGIGLLGLTFSVAFGSWIIAIISQSAERAELIAQLEQTRADLAEANREAGVLAERDRLASEIHDTVAQGFTSIVMLVQAAEVALESEPHFGQLRRQLALIDRTARDNLAETRALVADLTPAALMSATLADALARLTDRIGQELGIEAKFRCAGERRPLGTSREVVLLRVCQESLANVRKHAHAATVLVGLDYTEAGARLEVHDDGTGFDPARTSEGYGLPGMRARLAEIGGGLDVSSAPGEGTTIRAEVG
jgi:signal transduction histidine kinase